MNYTSKVIKGSGEGKKLGFPTINIIIPSGFDAKEGIYACWINISNKKYKGALHYGPIPSYDSDRKALEIHVLDYEPKANEPTPTEVSFELGQFLRPIKEYQSLENLRVQIGRDVKQVDKILTQV